MKEVKSLSPELAAFFLALESEWTKLDESCIRRRYVLCVHFIITS